MKTTTSTKPGHLFFALISTALLLMQSETSRGQIASIPAGSPSGPGNNSRDRAALWEWEQRAYPLGYIPDGARSRAAETIQKSKGQLGTRKGISAVSAIGLKLNLQSITRAGDRVIASSDNSPDVEGVANAIDQTPSKYLNFDVRIDGSEGGFVVRPSMGPTTIVGIRMQSANDHSERDPKVVTVEGSNDDTIDAFNSGKWTLIAEIDPIPAWTELFPGGDRLKTQEFLFANTNSYKSYRWTVWDTQIPNDCCFQIAEVEFLVAPQAVIPPPPPPPLQSKLWVSVGPSPQMNGQIGRQFTRQSVSGRVRSIAVDPGNSNHWLLGAARGGLWETLDGGATWIPRGDDQPSLGMGAIAFAPGNAKIIYAGTGEESQLAGGGLLKSSDGGRTWQLVAVDTFAKTSFSDIAVDSTNPDVLVVATTYGVNALRDSYIPGAPGTGVFKSTDGGKSWRLALQGTATSIEAVNSDFRRQYASLWSVGLFRSTNTGDEWKAVAGPWANAKVGRIELALSPTAGNVLYVSVAKPSGQGYLGLWKTENAWDPVPAWTQIPVGATDDGSGKWGCCGWNKAFGSAGDQCWYNHKLLVDSLDSNVLYFGGIDLWRYDQNGWKIISNTTANLDNGIHQDQHSLAWAGSRLITGNDGGAWSTSNGGQTWTSHNATLAITTFYYGSVHPDNPDIIMAGAQDNGTSLRNAAGEWFTISGGDGAGNAISYQFPDSHRAVSSQNLGLTRIIKSKSGAEDYVPAKTGLAVSASGSVVDAPFIGSFQIHPANENLLITGTKKVWRSDDFFTAAGPRWKANSPEFDSKISALAFAASDVQGNTYAVGTSKGSIQLTVDQGKSWKNLNPEGAMPRRYVTGLAFDPQNSRVLYVTLSGFDEGTPGKPGHLFKTANATDAKPAWENVTPPGRGSSLNLPHNCILIDPNNPSILYVGTDVGVWQTLDGGDSWTHFGPESGIPNVAVFDLKATRSSVVVAFTNGRGAFRYDPNAVNVLPTVIRVSPSDGGPGTVITVDGTKLAVVSSVEVGGIPAQFTIKSHNQMTLTVPAIATTGPIKLIAPGGTVTSSWPRAASSGAGLNSFTPDTNPAGKSLSELSPTVANQPQPLAFSKAPVIASFAPNRGLPGSRVTIDGFNFTGATQVSFGTVNATDFTVTSPNQIVATVPAKATSSRIEVKTSAGTILSSASFNVTNEPLVSGFVPPRGGAGQTITISGANFSGTTKVTFNNIVAVFKIQSATEIIATVPTNATTGLIAVFTPFGNAASPTSFGFVPPPTITSFSPIAGGSETQVTITGTDFIGVTAVAFNGLSASRFEVFPSTKIVVTLPVGARSGQLAVTTAGGTASSSAVFQVPVPPGNDNFVAAQAISGAVNSISGHNESATREIGEPSHAGNEGGKSVWFKWTAPATGAWVFDTDGSDFDTLLAVYSGSTLTTLAVVAANEYVEDLGISKVIFSAVGGREYLIAVDGFKEDDAGDLDSAATSADAGNLILNWAQRTTGPTLSGMTPPSSEGGVVVTLHGANLFGATTVTFNGVNASEFEVDSESEISVRVPAGGTSGPVRVSTPAGLATSGTDFVVRPGPSHDKFSASQIVTGDTGAISSRTVGATKEANEPNHGKDPGGASVWYVWTAPATGSWTWSTFGSQFDTLLAVYKGTNVAALTPIASNHADGPRGSSRLVLAAVQGTAYHIAVDGFEGATGELVLSWARSADVPLIMKFSPKIGTEGTSVTITGANFTGTIAVTFNDVKAGLATLTSAKQIVVTIPDGAETGPIRISTPRGTAESFENFVIAVPSPTNDHFANAQPLIGDAAIVSGTNRGATKEGGETDHANDSGGSSVWYVWKATTNGFWTVDTLGSNFDTLLAVYTGARLDQLTLVAANDEFGQEGVSRLTFAAVSGTVYHLAVDGYEEDSGKVVLRLVPPGDSKVIYATGFEVAEGHATNGVWAGRLGWEKTGTGDNGILHEWFPESGQQAYLGYQAPKAAGNVSLSLSRPLNHTPDLKQAPIVRFSVTMAVQDSENDQFDVFRWTVRNQNLDPLFGLAFDNSDLGVYYDLQDGKGLVYTGVDFATETIYALEITMDFAQNKWTAILDDGVERQTLARALNLAPPGKVQNLGRIAAEWSFADPSEPGDNFMVIDDYRVVAEREVVPRILLPPVNQTGALGGRAALTVLAGGPERFQYQWRFNGEDLTGANDPVLNFASLSSLQAGRYSVVVANDFGIIVSEEVRLTVGDAVAATVKLSATLQKDGGLLLNVNGPAARIYAIESSNDLQNWKEFGRKDNPTGTVSFLVNPSASSTYQFYRARQVP